MSCGTRRHRSRGETASVSLFPFLAVLICTMGALIVLLVVTVQQAGDSATGTTERSPFVSATRVDEPPTDAIQFADGDADDFGVSNEVPEMAEAAADPLQLHQNVSQLETLQRTQEDLAWQAESLAAARQSTLERLKEQQLHLSGIEDQSFTLQRELTRLRDEVEAMKQAAAGEQPDEHAAAHLKQLEADLELARTNLAEAQKQQKNQRPRYTIIPHRGVNGTNRRPLYVECLPDKVVLQPEGLVLTQTDFRAPLGPDNPLASALRAKREFLLNAGAVASSGEPYPLLLVRPGGELFYGWCRDALIGWDEEFGYELVPDEFDLAYPPTNRMMGGFMEQIVTQVRTRRDRAFAMAASSMDSVPDGTVIMGISHESGGFEPTASNTTRQPDVARADAPNPNQESSVVSTAAAESTGNGDSSFGRSNTIPSQGSQPNNGRQSDWQEGAGTANGSTSGTATSAAGGDSSSAGTPDGQSASQSSPHAQVGHYAMRGDSTRTARIGTGSNQPTSNVAFAAAASSSASGSNSNTANSNGAASGSPADSAGQESSAASAQVSFSIAKTQGQNWALPNDTAGAIGVVRPVQLTCTKDSIIMHPESQIGQAQMEIPFAVTTSSAVQPFIGALWNRMEDWGVAGNGMYWQPQIQCEVVAGGEERFQELSGLLHGSGLTITRR